MRKKGRCWSEMRKKGTVEVAGKICLCLGQQERRFLCRVPKTAGAQVRPTQKPSDKTGKKPTEKPTDLVHKQPEKTETTNRGPRQKQHEGRDAVTSAD